MTDIFLGLPQFHLDESASHWLGLIALADLCVVAYRTAVTGTSSYMDVLVLVPGMHLQQSSFHHSSRKINCDELPMVGSMTTGDIFPLENPAMVSYLQSIGRTGHLVTLRISPHPIHNTELSFTDRHIRSLFVTGIPATLLYLLSPTLTVIVVVFLCVIEDWRGLGVMAMFMLSRLINVVVVRRRRKRWELVRKPNSEDELLVLLSQDRWFRLHGMSEDLKVVTSRQWRKTSAVEGIFVSFAKLLVYTAVVLCPFASTVGCLTIVCLLLCSSALLGLCNFFTPCLRVFNYVVHMEGKPEKYQEKNILTNGMIHKSGRHDWPYRRLIVPTDGLKGEPIF